MASKNTGSTSSLSITSPVWWTSSAPISTKLPVTCAVKSPNSATNTQVSTNPAMKLSVQLFAISPCAGGAARGFAGRSVISTTSWHSTSTLSPVASKNEPARYGANLQGEIDGAAMYRAMAELEPQPQRAEIYRRLAGAEERHAGFWEERLHRAGG